MTVLNYDKVLFKKSFVAPQLKKFYTHGLTGSWRETLLLPRLFNVKGAQTGYTLENKVLIFYLNF